MANHPGNDKDRQNEYLYGRGGAFADGKQGDCPNCPKCGGTWTEWYTFKGYRTKTMAFLQVTPAPMYKGVYCNTCNKTYDGKRVRGGYFD